MTVSQQQTEEVFGYKWAKRDTYEEAGARAHQRAWMLECFGDITAKPWFRGRMLDAGCGAAASTLDIFGDALKRVEYTGVDISTAVDVAKQRFAERGIAGTFLRADINEMPLPLRHFDVIYSAGVLHHTDSTEHALKAVARHLAPGGHFMFYVYRKKSPLREYADDLIRDKIQALSPEDAWKALEPLTKLGIALGQLETVVDVPEAVEVLGIPAGKIDIQRLFYWHIFKAFYNPAYSYDAMHHINFDWYAPKNSHRQTPEQVRQWCAEADLEIAREHVDEAGIAIIATRQS